MNIRQTILDALEEAGHSKYWLASQAAKNGVANEQTVYRYLRGDRDTSGEIIGQFFDLLGLSVSAPRRTRKSAG